VACPKLCAQNQQMTVRRAVLAATWLVSLALLPFGPGCGGRIESASPGSSSASGGPSGGVVTSSSNGSGSSGGSVSSSGTTSSGSSSGSSGGEDAHGTGAVDATASDAWQPGTDGVECLVPDDCETLLGPLPNSCSTMCPNGPKGGCQHYVCLQGICQTTYCAAQPANPPSSECAVPDDCETLLGPLPDSCSNTCPNGANGGCLHYVCLQGICQTTYCAAQPANPPSSECAAPADCEALLGPLPNSCSNMCPNGPNGGCEHYLCVSGICLTSYCK
jgi:hypothetical protein